MAALRIIQQWLGSVRRAGQDIAPETIAEIGRAAVLAHISRPAAFARCRAGIEIAALLRRTDRDSWPLVRRDGLALRTAGESGEQVRAAEARRRGGLAALIVMMEPPLGIWITLRVDEQPAAA